MRIGVLVTRQFAARVNGRTVVTQARRTAELAIPPCPGMILAFADGTPDCVVSKVRHRVLTAGQLGILPVEVEVIGCREPSEGLEAALSAGWVAAEPAPESPATV
jgi:hypothetical protein